MSHESVEMEQEGSKQRKRRLPPVIKTAGEDSGEPMLPEKVEQRLKAERVEERLKRLPGWKLAAGGRAIDRVRQFRDAASASAYAGFAAELVAGDRQRLRIELFSKQVVLTLQGAPRTKGDRGGITESVLNLAADLG